MRSSTCSVELLERPGVAQQAVIVRRSTRTGAASVSAASYEARRCGVHSAMPLRCRRTAVARTRSFLEGRHDLYAEWSRPHGPQSWRSFRQ